MVNSELKKHNIINVMRHYGNTTAKLNDLLNKKTSVSDLCLSLFIIFRL